MKLVLPCFVRVGVVALVVVLAACETTVPTQKFSDITFAHMPPIRLDVADIEYIQEYVPPQAPPNVEHLFPVQPAAVVRRWTADRLLATGVTRRLRVILVNAAVTENALETKGGVTGFLTNEQAVRYDETLEVRLEIVDDRGMQEGHARAVAQRSRTAPENITLNERDQLWFDLTEDLMKALDAELERVIRTYLARYVR
jgi:hypothetical protein